MESIKSTLKATEESISDSPNFFTHVFMLNDKDKSELMNIVQYVLFAITPLILILKLMKHFIPSEEPNKSSLELSLEVVLQLLFIFVSFYFVHRMITFIPTYSTMNYPDFSFIYVILPTLLILFTMQTKLGSKINTLNDRMFKALGISTVLSEEEEPVRKNSHESQGQNEQQHQQQHQQQQPHHNEYSQQNNTEFSHPFGGKNFDDMYLDTKTPIVNANNPTNGPNINNYNQANVMTEPMAANGFGGMGGTFY